jgi:hypothetical protein
VRDREGREERAERREGKGGEGLRREGQGQGQRYGKIETFITISLLQVEATDDRDLLLKESLSPE